jgi:hypothetical protein
MSGSTTARSVMIYNERTKLLANALDRASTALGVGGLFAMYGGWHADHTPADPTHAAPYLSASGAFLFCAIMIHLVARWVLKRLQ